MGSYGRAAAFYDLLQGAQKDYVAEARLLEGCIREARPDARSILDVACGTGGHARALTDLGFQVDGVDLEPAFLEIARRKCPEGRFTLGDMTALKVPGRYDVVTCLFAAIGHLSSEEALRRAIASMRAHLTSGGVLLVDPWFEPGQLTHGWVSTLSGKSDEVTVSRMSRTVLQEGISRLEFEYLVGRASGIQRISEVHDLTLFTQNQIQEAFVAAGFRVDRKPRALLTRGIYVGTLPRA
jgi:SAM-dependent methyltransferase